MFTIVQLTRSFHFVVEFINGYPTMSSIGVGFWYIIVIPSRTTIILSLLINKTSFTIEEKREKDNFGFNNDILLVFKQLHVCSRFTGHFQLIIKQIIRNNYRQLFFIELPQPIPKSTLAKPKVFLNVLCITTVFNNALS